VFYFSFQGFFMWGLCVFYLPCHWSWFFFKKPTSGFIGWFCSHSFFAFSSSKFLISTEVNMSFSNDMDDEYEKLFRRLNPPRYVLCRFVIFFFFNFLSESDLKFFPSWC